MRSSIPLACLWLSLFGPGGDDRPQVLAHFETSGRTRLAALARLSGLTRTTFLVEGGDLGFLQGTTSLESDGATVDEVATAILRGPEEYSTEHHGALLVIVPRRPLEPLSRMLRLPLGPFKFGESSVSALYPRMEYQIRQASGCDVSGYAWAGPSLDLAIPPFALSAATFQQIVEHVAEAPEPTLWVVGPDDGRTGCLEMTGGGWEVGFPFTERIPVQGRDRPFWQSVGPELVR